MEDIMKDDENTLHSVANISKHLSSLHKFQRHSALNALLEQQKNVGLSQFMKQHSMMNEFVAQQKIQRERLNTILNNTSLLNKNTLPVFPSIKFPTFSTINMMENQLNALNKYRESLSFLKRKEYLAISNYTKMALSSVEVGRHLELSKNVSQLFAKNNIDSIIKNSQLALLQSNMMNFPSIKRDMDSLIINNTFLTNTLKEYNDTLASLHKQIDFRSSDTIHLSGNEISITDLQNTLDSVVENINKKYSATFDEFVKSINALIETIKEPSHRKLIKFIISHLLSPLMVLFIWSLYTESHSPIDKRKHLKEVNTAISSSVNNRHALINYRYVNTEKLIIRSTSSSKSKALGELEFLQIVTLIEKKGDWSLIEWQDNESEASIKGWVFSRYVSKFK